MKDSLIKKIPFCFENFLLIGINKSNKYLERLMPFFWLADLAAAVFIHIKKLEIDISKMWLKHHFNTYIVTGGASD